MTLRVLIVDDEQPALDELAWLLDRDDRIGEITCCGSATDALTVLRDTHVDAVFLDIEMPGLTGLDLSAVVARFETPPAVVFVTAHAEHAVDAFDLHAVDYVLKPPREERLREAVRRIVEMTTAGTAPQADDTIPVELGGVTRFVSRSEVRYVEAQGDYCRLHTDDAGHLVRLPISALEERWGPAGFVRIHRSLLVALEHIDEIRVDGARCSAVVGGRELTVSRRHTPMLRELLRQRRDGRQDPSSSGSTQR